MHHNDGTNHLSDHQLLRHSLGAVAVGLGLVVGFHMLLNAVVQPFGTELDDGWLVSYRAEERFEPAEIPFKKELSELTTVALETRVGSTANSSLALLRPNATAIDVYWNGRRIHRIGDPQQATANLWNAGFSIPLPDSPDSDNRLRIELTSSYQIELPQAPIIASHHLVQQCVFLHNLVYQDLRVLLMGAAIAVGTILIFLSRLQGSAGLAGLFLGVAAILSAGYAADYGLRFTTGSLTMYRWSRILAISSAYVTTLLFTMGLEQYFRRRHRLSWIVGVPITIVVLLMIGSPSTAWLFRWLPTFRIVLYTGFLAVLSFAISRVRQRPYLLVPFTIISLSLVEGIVVLAFGLPWPSLMQLTVPVTAILFSAQIIIDYTEVYERREKLEAAYNRDALTGAYNRHLLGDLRLSDYDVAVVTDLDNFKAYNDNHGHAAGDAVLKAYAMTLASNTRGEDVVVRYGGDEFVVLIKHATEEDAQRIMQRVRERFRWQIQGGSIDVSFGVQPIAHDKPDQFTQADSGMYAMKAEHHAGK
jgi:diguanylate cyclase (GGDEF)-like protein